MEKMMILSGVLVAAMMLLCVAAAAGLFPNEGSRKLLRKLLARKELAFFNELREALHEA